jgi:hypothetical protein
MTPLEVIGQFIVPAFLGLGGGIVGQWLGWGLEKRRILLQRRAALVDRWRNDLFAASPPSGDSEGGRPALWILHTPVYQSLRPYLPSEFTKRVEAPRTLFVDAPDDFPRARLLEEVDRIERSWGSV